MFPFVSFPFSGRMETCPGNKGKKNPPGDEPGGKEKGLIVRPLGNQTFFPALPMMRGAVESVLSETARMVQCR